MREWEEYLQRQANAFGGDAVDKWLRTLRVLRFDARNLFLEASDSFQILWFEEHVRPHLKENLLNGNRKPITVHLALAGKTSSGGPAPAKKNSRAALVAQPFKITFECPDPQNTFESFILTEENQLPYRLLQRLCHAACDATHGDLETQLGTFNPIYIYGPSACGKSHLLAATFHAINLSGLKPIYCTAQTFAEHVVQAIRSGEMHLFRQAYRTADILLIDDVHSLARKAATQEELFHTFNALHLDGKQIILTANCPPAELQSIEPRLISRFEWGVILPVEPLPRGKMQALLEEKCRQLRFPLNQKTSIQLCEQFGRSAHVLMKSLQALILRTHHLAGAHSISSTALTPQQINHYLSDFLDEERAEELTPDKIIKQTASYYGIKTEDIVGKAQTRECALARQIAVFLCRKKLQMPFTQIGSLVSRHHSTVISSVQQIEKQIESKEQPLLLAIKEIEKKL